MDKFVKVYWKKLWILNLFITLLVCWGVIDSVRGKYSVWWMYFTLVIFSWFTMAVRNNVKKDYKLFRQGLFE